MGGPVQEPHIDQSEVTESRHDGSLYPPVLILNKIPHFKAECLAVQEAIQEDESTGTRSTVGQIAIRKGKLGLYVPLELSTLDLLIANLSKVRAVVAAEAAAGAGVAN